MTHFILDWDGLDGQHGRGRWGCHEKTSDFHVGLILNQARDDGMGHLVAEMEQETEHRTAWDRKHAVGSNGEDDPIIMVPLPTSVVRQYAEELGGPPDSARCRLALACREALPKTVTIEILMSTRDAYAGWADGGCSTLSDVVRACKRSALLAAADAAESSVSAPKGAG